MHASIQLNLKHFAEMDRPHPNGGETQFQLWNGIHIAKNYSQVNCHLMENQGNRVKYTLFL